MYLRLGYIFPGMPQELCFNVLWCAFQQTLYRRYFSENGIRLTTYKSQKPGRPRVAFSALKGGPCRRALSVMGNAIIQSENIFDPHKKLLLGSF